MIEFCITLYRFLCSDLIALPKDFEGWKDANHNEKNPVKWVSINLKVLTFPYHFFIFFFQLGFY